MPSAMYATKHDNDHLLLQTHPESRPRLCLWKTEDVEVLERVGRHPDAQCSCAISEYKSVARFVLPTEESIAISS